MRTNLYTIVLLLSLFVFGLQKTHAQTDSIATATTTQKATFTDVLTLKNPPVKNDSIRKDSLTFQKKTKEAIEAIIDHTAEDYIVEDVINKQVLLYDKAVVKYKDITISAGQININYQTNIVIAKGIRDSIGAYAQLPVFVQGGQESTQDSIVFNFKTKKAIIYGLKTEQNGIITLGSKMKKMNDSTIFGRNFRFTTSNKPNPDYYLRTNKVKIVPGKKIIVGSTNLVVADVPTPLILPFAYLPITTKKASGFIVPTYGESNQQGFFLQNGGFYFAGNDYFDLTLLGDIYSNSSWGLSAATAYKVRYKFSGFFNFRFENLIFGLKGFDDFSRRTNFNMRWTHNQDSKSSPNSRLSASVNLGSSTYYRQSLNQLNNSQALTNTLNSSVSYYKKFVGTPFNMSVSATHSQNTNTEIITMSLPNLQLNMDRIFPFAPKTGSKKGALQKMGLNYSTRGNNSFSVTEDDFFTQKMFDEVKSGIEHRTALSTNIKLLKYFTLSPSANYKEVWYFKTIEKNYDNINQEVVTDTVNGFASFREYSVNAAISTNIYGMFKFKGKNLKAIRHTIRPSVSLGYRPDFSFFYDEVQRSADPNDIEVYSRFDNGIYGRPTMGLSQSVGLSVANNLEAKVRNKNATNDKDEFKKITLINNLNFNTSYNAAADSLRWSPVNFTASTALFQKKLSINIRGTLDPYALNTNNQRINTLNINNGGSLFRLTTAGLTMSYAISSKDFEKDKNGTRKRQQEDQIVNEQPTDLFGKNLTDNFTNSNPEANKDSKDEEEKEVRLYQNAMPWDVSFSYTSAYQNSARENEISSNTLMINGNIELTPKWKIGASTGYDFKQQGFTYTSLRFSRDLDSWGLNFNWVPFGNRRSYYFYIGVKSPFLSDLKWEKRNAPDRRLF